MGLSTGGAELEAQEVLDVLEVFGEDGVRMYLVGFWKASKNAWKTNSKKLGH